MKYNIAILGYGKIGQLRHSILKKLKKINRLYIFDPKNKKKSNVNKYIDIFLNKEIDIIFICTPNFLNYDYTLLGLKYKKHIFCEKPPVLTLSQMKKINKVEKQSNKVLMYGFNHRHYESVKFIKKLINNKQFGKILWMRGRYGKGVDQNFYKEWRSKKKLAGGGILIDQGIHMLDLFLFLADDFDKVKASVSNLYWKSDVEDNVFAILENSKSKIVASLHSTATQWRHLFSLEIFLRDGYIVLNGLKTSSNTYGREKLTYVLRKKNTPSTIKRKEVIKRYSSNKSWINELNLFFKYIRKKQKAKSSNSSDALKIMKLLDLIYKQK